MAIISGRFISNNIINVYSEAVGQLRLDIGRQVTFIFDPFQSGCPNSFLNPQTHRDSRRWNSSNPFSSGIINVPPFGSGTYSQQFIDGQICPVCKDNFWLVAPSSINYQANVSWFSELDEQFIGGDKPAGDAEIKVTISGFEDAERAKQFLVDGIYCEKIKSPIKVGLRDPITTLIRIQRIGKA